MASTCFDEISKLKGVLNPVGRIQVPVKRVDAVTTHSVKIADVEKVVVTDVKQQVKVDLQTDKAVYTAKALNSNLANNAYLTVMATPLPYICSFEITAIGGGSDAAISRSTVYVRSGTFVGIKHAHTCTQLAITADQTNGIRVQNISGGALGVRAAALCTYND